MEKINFYALKEFSENEELKKMLRYHFENYTWDRYKSFNRLEFELEQEQKIKAINADIRKFYNIV